MRSGRILIILGLVLAVGAAGLSFFILQNADTGQEQEEVEERSVVVAVQPVEARSEIPPDALRVEPWPVNIAPQNSFTSTAQVAGQLTIAPIFPGQVILNNMVVSRLSETQQPTQTRGSDVSFTIPEGQVAVAFPVSSIATVAGAIRQGDTVDLMVTLQPPSIEGGGQAGPGNVAGFTLQNLEVIRTRPWNVEEGDGGGTVYTMLVDRQQALILKYVRENATPDFALRPAGDNEEYDTDPVDLNYIITEFDLEPVQP